MSLIFAAIGPHSRLIHPCKYQLSYSVTGLQLDGATVRIEQLQRDFAGKAGINPAGVLNKQSHTAKGASPLHKCGQVIGQADIFPGRCQDKLSRSDTYYRITDFCDSLIIEISV